MKTLYEGNVTASGARAGSIESEDGALAHDLAVPTSMGGKGGDGTNPEQLFAGAYSACFGSALLAVSSERNIELGDDFTVSATIGFNKDEDGYFLSADLDCYLPTIDKETGIELINEAHEICPFSKATRDNIEVNLHLLMDE